MGTLIFRSFLLIWAIIDSSSSERRSKTTVPPPARWMPSRPIALSTQDYSRFAVSTLPPTKPEVHTTYNNYEPVPPQRSSKSKKNHEKLDNYLMHSSSGSFQRSNEPAFIPTPIPITTWSSLDNSHHDVQSKSTSPTASIHNHNKFQSPPVIENNSRLKSRIEFSDEDFDIIFNTQPHAPPKNVHIPMHRNMEHYQLLSDQPQLHFHMNPSQQGLYSTRTFGNMGQSQVFSEFPKKGENPLENGKMMEDFDPFQYSEFSEMPSSNIFKNYDRIFGKHSKIKPESFRVQKHYPSKNEGIKQEEEEDIEEYRSSEASSERYEKSRESEDEERADHERIEEFDESYRKEIPHHGSKYVKETERDSSERPEARSGVYEDEPRRSTEIDDKTRATTKFPPFRYKIHQQRPSNRKSQRSTSQEPKKYNNSSRKIHS